MMQIPSLLTVDHVVMSRTGCSRTLTRFSLSWLCEFKSADCWHSFDAVDLMSGLLSDDALQGLCSTKISSEKLLGMNPGLFRGVWVNMPLEGNSIQCTLRAISRTNMVHILKSLLSHERFLIIPNMFSIILWKMGCCEPWPVGVQQGGGAD